MDETWYGNNKIKLKSYMWCFLPTTIHMPITYYYRRVVPILFYILKLHFLTHICI